jgi:hypothetical protein
VDDQSIDDLAALIERIEARHDAVNSHAVREYLRERGIDLDGSVEDYIAEQMSTGPAIEQPLNFNDE